MPKISELPVLAEAAADDIVALVDTSGSVTNKVTRSGLVTGGFPLIATAGTSAAFTLALPASLTNAAGQSFNIRFHLAPDAGATIAIDGQTALALRLYDGAGALTALAAGDVVIDSVVEVTLIDDGGTLRAVVNRDRTLAVSAPDCIFTGPAQAGTGTMTLDTTVRNVGGFATLSSNVVTLAAGSYLITGYSVIRLTGAITAATASIAIRDNTGTSDVVAQGLRDSDFGSQALLRVSTIVSPGSSNDYSLNFARDNSSYQIGGAGLASGHSGASDEISHLEIWRLS